MNLEIDLTKELILNIDVVFGVLNGVKVSVIDGMLNNKKEIASEYLEICKKITTIIIILLFAFHLITSVSSRPRLHFALLLKIWTLHGPRSGRTTTDFPEQENVFSLAGSSRSC